MERKAQTEAERPEEKSRTAQSEDMVLWKTWKTKFIDYFAGIGEFRRGME